MNEYSHFGPQPAPLTRREWVEIIALALFYQAALFLILPSP